MSPHCDTFTHHDASKARNGLSCVGPINCFGPTSITAIEKTCSHSDSMEQRLQAVICVYAANALDVPRQVQGESALFSYCPDSPLEFSECPRKRTVVDFRY